ncbi:PQQ enzyme repeat protein [Phycisphaerae bacterium RAS1]|nr:PQQ enzyme repeat protein [Phycisphaerae bacterium RAS1]
MQTGFPASLRSLSAALAALSVVLPGEAQQPARAPTWVFQSDAAIEWCRLAGADRSTVVLATQRGDVHVLRASDGTSIAGSPLRFSPGVRVAAGESPDSAAPTAASQPGLGSMAFFERASLTLAEVRPLFRERWRTELGPVLPHDNCGPLRKPDDDPEFLPRLAAVSAEAGGVLALAEDGRLVEIDAATGKTRWTAQLPRLSGAALTADPSAVAATGRAGGGATIRVYDRRDGAARLAKDLQDSERIEWTGMIDGELIAVTSGSVLAIRGGDVRQFDRPSSAGRTWIDVHRPKKPDGGAAAPRLIFCDGRRLSAVEVSTGRAVWATALPIERGTFEALLVRSDHVLVRSPGAIAVLDASSGEQRLYTVSASAARFLDADCGPEVVRAASADEKGVLHCGILGISERAPPAARWITLADATRESPQFVWGERFVLIVSRNAVERFELDR